MPDDTARIATLVGSRLCHDLVSPVGAISNGLELIALAGTPGPEEMSLIEQSCASAAARISFFRVAFGSASDDQKIGPREAAKVLRNYCNGTRLSVDWLPQTDSQRTEVQLAYLAMLCCESALPQGGRVQITQESGIWRISGTGARLAVEPALWEQLSSRRLGADLTPARVQFACLARLAPERGRKLTVHAGDAAVTIEIA
ncbi:histidine phosphotransferase family protein [Salipiger sp. P9]|uniref:histidine phosphotransferase family protein n=1 Tax=Salipiger pentaromativorans TaxID=2943193 RepID=UPI002157C4BA|nr:histidine phosphotransferase family protein [Salipiger pentaromativorans]MCR8547078.1 histidine phosphotransferase family protein [Salipiger pentaromativorans]